MISLFIAVLMLRLGRLRNKVHRWSEQLWCNVYVASGRVGCAQVLGAVVLRKDKAWRQRKEHVLL